MVGVKIIQEIWYNTLKSVYLLFCTNLFFFSFAGLLRLAIYSNHGHLTVHSEYSFLSQSFDLPWRHPSSLVCHEFIYQSRLEWGKFSALWSQGVELCPHTMNGDWKRWREGWLLEEYSTRDQGHCLSVCSDHNKSDIFFFLSGECSSMGGHWLEIWLWPWCTWWPFCVAAPSLQHKSNSSGSTMSCWVMDWGIIDWPRPPDSGTNLCDYVG